MTLPNDLISQFTKITNTEEKKTNSKTYGTIVEYNGSKFIRLDGSELLTPVSSTTNLVDGDRVTAEIKDHSIIATGNLTSPAARTADVENLKEEVSTLLKIESSRGTVFKNDTISTVLSIVIYHGSTRITTNAEMRAIFGPNAYLQWKWQRATDNTFGVISSDDSRFGDGGFTFTLSPSDVNTKVTFMCELIT